jgi:hypothetical protein
MIRLSAGTTERPATKGGVTIMNLINTAYTANLSVILSEDVGSPELRNPKLSGMSKARMHLFSRLIKAISTKK